MQIEGDAGDAGHSRRKSLIEGIGKKQTELSGDGNAWSADISGTQWKSTQKIGRGYPEQDNN